MTEYWVSQGNKWCDFCKIFISSNPATIRNHELGQRHKDNVAKRLSDMRKDKAVKEKKEKEAANALQQIEAKARRSYQKDIASFEEARQSHEPEVLDDEDGGPAWEYDSSSGYYKDPSTGVHYDPKSGFYYSDILGKWVTRQEAFASIHSAGSKKKVPLGQASSSLASDAAEEKRAAKLQGGSAPGPVLSRHLNPMRSVKGAASSLAIGKRKRADTKPKAVSAEEADALKAREAARKRVEEREKKLLGLYGH